MKNKVLIKLLVPEIDEEYDIFVPINIRVGSLIYLLNSSLTEISGGLYESKNNRKLHNVEDGTIYESDKLIRETNIRNGTALIYI